MASDQRVLTRREWVLTTRETSEDPIPLPLWCLSCGGILIIQTNDAHGHATGACRDCGWTFQIDPPRTTK